MLFNDCINIDCCIYTDIINLSYIIILFLHCGNLVDKKTINYNGVSCQALNNLRQQPEGLRILARLVARELVARRRQKQVEVSDSNSKEKNRENIS